MIMIEEKQEKNKGKDCFLDVQCLFQFMSLLSNSSFLMIVLCRFAGFFLLLYLIQKYNEVDRNTSNKN